MKYNKIEYLKRYITLFIGLFILSLGIAFSIKADLGTSPISGLPYVVSLISPLSVGTATIIMHCTFILLQILILRKDYDPIQLLQLPVALVFGLMTDVAVLILNGVTYSGYLSQWLLCAIGIVLVALGVSIEVAANVIVVAGEGLILAICRVTHMKFGNAKVCFDVTLVASAILVGLFSRGQILGVREGTVAAALFVGMITKLFRKPVNAAVEKLTKSKD